MIKDVEKAKEQIYSNLSIDKCFNVKIVRTVKEFEEAIQLSWDSVYMEEVYKGKWSISSEIIYI